MYVTSSVFDKIAQFIDVDDRQFFATALNEAKQRQSDNSLESTDCDLDDIKKHCPVCYMSTVAKRTDADEYIDRKTLNKRGRRKFIMIDADFEESQADESSKLRTNLIKLADKLNTWLLIYPTLSFPVKPRFRAVLFAKRQLDANSYIKAMKWLYEQCDTKPTDGSDLRIVANRNLPLFINDEQIASIYSNLDDDSRTALDNALWKNVKAPTTDAKPVEYDAPRTDITYDFARLCDGCKRLARQPICSEYNSFWPVAKSIAAAVVMKSITKPEAEQLLDILAEGGSSDEECRRWARGNRQLLDKHIVSCSLDKDELMMARPLYTYTELVPAVR